MFLTQVREHCIAMIRDRSKELRRGKGDNEEDQDSRGTWSWCGMMRHPQPLCFLWQVEAVIHIIVEIVSDCWHGRWSNLFADDISFICPHVFSMAKKLACDRSFIFHIIAKTKPCGCQSTTKKYVASILKRKDFQKLSRTNPGISGVYLKVLCELLKEFRLLSSGEI